MLFNFNERMEMDAHIALSLSISLYLSAPLSNSCALFIMTILFVCLGQGENESGKCGVENGASRRKRALAQKRRLWAINGNSGQCQ